MRSEGTKGGSDGTPKEDAAQIEKSSAPVKDQVERVLSITREKFNGARRNIGRGKADTNGK